MPKKEKPRFAVVITREMVEEWTVYVSADSPEEADEAADEIFQHCSFPEFELIHSEYFLSPSPIDPRHEVQPTRVDLNQGMVCAVCLRSVEWTGTAADDPSNRSGVTIPGPWQHVTGETPREGS